MIAITIKNLKNFMNHLLISDTFDHFLVSEATITTFASFTIDGTLHPDFYEPEKAEELRSLEQKQIFWSDIRPYCFSIIKGRRTPLSFRIILQLPKEEVEALVAKSGMSIASKDVSGLFLNCQFNGETLTLTTGSSLRLFTMDKSLDHAFDKRIQEFLIGQEIEFLLP